MPDPQPPTSNAQSLGGHLPVLPEAVLGLLDPQPGQVYADATAGKGGHALLVARRLGPTGTVVLNDLDRGNLEDAQRSLMTIPKPDRPRIETIHGSFDDLPSRIEALGLRADGVLADLGFASNQIDDPARGLSFRRDGPLDMRLDPGSGITAADLIASLPEHELADLIYQNGEERLSRRIARKVVEIRELEPIETTGRLAEIVRAAYPPSGRRARIDPATRTFQALRIAVNDELGALESLLGGVTRAAEGDSGWLAPEACVVIISFHSLEDRPVKRAFRALADRGLAQRLTKKPAVADQDERDANPRSRSAKARAIRLIPAT